MSYRPDKSFDALNSASELASDMLAVVRDELLVTYRFMNRPLARLPIQLRMDLRSCATDARTLMFSPGFVLGAFQNARPLLARAYLHMTLHCLLRHPFPPQGADVLRWSCAADAAVCALLAELDSPAIHVENAERDEELALIAERASQPTAQALYSLFEREATGEDELSRLELLFGMDAHDPWLPQTAPDAQSREQDDKARAELQKRWEKVARQTEMDAASDDSSLGDAARSLALARPDAQPMGLEELLRIFAAPNESIRANPDEFDYVYYLYGLSTYGNMPLVEPLEYCESPQVRDFVVAIDTSGSVDQRMVELFVSRACGMLLEGSAFGKASRVRVMQCDMRVQDERVLENAEDIAGYLDGLEVRGRGGTDFRPVFDRIDELMERGAIKDMSGLVYFTDGLGEFPEQAPPYDAAFVFVDKLGPAPTWATSVLTYADELARE